jgi:50S ribosomal protein L16 3-hydroxylase
MRPRQTRALLGGLSVDQFLRRYWHKRACLIRQAHPAPLEIVDLRALQRIAARDDVESRVVLRVKSRWSVEHGPFAKAFWRNLPPTHWTLLVQGLNHWLPRADQLLRRFAFVPYARLDDVMVSYAAPMGGVGPHVDSYDVFLLQGPGRRRWRINTRADPQLDPRAPIKILKRFRAEHEWVLGEGDMLYLPPHVAHEGTAIDACLTYSIGFRAPSHAELAEVILQYLQESFRPSGHYADPDLAPSTHPAALPRPLDQLETRDRDVADALGQYLSTPKANVVFDRPAAPLSSRRFVAVIARVGVVLDRRTIMLFAGSRFFINGERVTLAIADRVALRRLADTRALHGARFAASETCTVLHDWYRSGWLHVGAANDRRSP